MKISFKIVISAAAVLFSLNSFSQPAVKTITVINPLPIERKDELIVLSKTFLQKKLATFSESKYIILTKGRQPQVVQFDDINGDGVWDEACFLYNFQPSEKVVFSIVVNDKPAAVKAIVRSHVRQMHKLPDESFGLSVRRDTMPYNNQPTDFSKQKLPPYLTEGPAWENDKVGFRKYFDVRNANDVWGKVTNKMVLDEVGVHPEVIYHNFNPAWGMDILKVGKSLGAGGLALQIKIGEKDSLVRFGTNVAQTIYEQIADGPLRAVFRIKYMGWKIDGLPPINATEEVSIWGGQYFFENRVMISDAPEGSKLVTGLNNFYTKNSYTLSSANTKALYTFGVQSENRDNLGMAVMMPIASFSASGQTPDAGSEVLNTYTIAQKISNRQLLIYRYYVGWEKTSNRFATKQGFEKSLKMEALKMGGPFLIN